MRLIISAFLLALPPSASRLYAQPPADDENPYGVEMPKADTAKPPARPVPAPPKSDTAAPGKKIPAPLPRPAPRDTVKAAPVPPRPDSAAKAADSIQIPPSGTAAAPPDSAPGAPDTASRRPVRPRLVRETTINSINQMQGSYRSPKKALFMSLALPGLGQAYVGQSAFNYSRAAAYFGADVLMGVLWYQYVVVKHDDQVRKYRGFADQNWSQERYESRIPEQDVSENTQSFFNKNPFRESYCGAVQSRSTSTGENLYQGCVEPGSEHYAAYANSYRDLNLSADSIHDKRAGFADPYQFYELIGQYQEFLTGWDDAQIAGSLSTPDSAIVGTSAHRDRYIDMRATANRYSRMQAWFIGGIVVNHLASALDAALTARYNNRRLYETQSSWYERLRFDGGLALDQGSPRTNFTAFLSF